MTYSRKKTHPFRWIFLVIFALIIQISAISLEYKIAFQDNEFLLEGIFQVINLDINDDGTDEIFLTGKNYVGREVFIYMLSLDSDFKPVIKWQSENLFEELSVLWLASGKFDGIQNQLLAVSNTRFYFYSSGNEGLNLTAKIPHNLKPLNIASGDIDGDGLTELIVARIGKITSKIYDNIIQVYKFEEGNLKLAAESGLVGNIRGLTAGDIDGDGSSEIIIDEGFRFDPGIIHILGLKDGRIIERYQKKLIKGAVYAMNVAAFPEGFRLITASQNGKIDFFGWENNGLVPMGRGIVLKSSFVSVTAADLNLDNYPELITAGYQQQFIIFTKQGALLTN